MRGVLPLLLLVALISGLLAQTVSNLPAPDEDPFVGTWQTNASKSRPKLDKADASYVRTIVRDGDEVVFSSRMDRRSVGGRLSENEYRIRCDGAPHQVQCGKGSCTTACTYTAENVVEGETVSLDGGERSYWTREVSTDRQEMRILGYKDKAKTKLKTTRVLDRVK
jgi:hypothetical protein